MGGFVVAWQTALIPLLPCLRFCEPFRGTLARVRPTPLLITCVDAIAIALNWLIALSPYRGRLTLAPPSPNLGEPNANV